jgi:hypothetical protein
MPAGLPYFAWIDASETTFTPAHLRWDEQIFSFTLQQDEGDPASLTVVVRRPRNVAGDPIGLLGPGRKIWAWFALDCGPDLIRFRGRLVGVPTSIFEELVTLEFIARPLDLVTQKTALADSLRVLPYYDEVVIEESRRTDPEVVLEGYSAIWHFDRETHVLTISDEITGEDGTIEFDGASEGGKVLWDGLSLSLTSGPLAQVDINAEFVWTQQGSGGVDLTRYLVDNWPNEPLYSQAGTITSFTLTADSWPKNGAGIGDGWTVMDGSCQEVGDDTVQTRTGGGETTVKWWDGDTTRVSSSLSEGYLTGPTTGAIGFPELVTSYSVSTNYAEDADGNIYASSYNGSMTTVSSVLLLHALKPTLVAGYKAARQQTERVSLTLVADVQPILTDPEDGETLRIDDVRSVNLSEAIGGVVPIGDPGRRSYIATARGNRSVEHLIALARAHLLKRARVVEIGFAPKLERMCEVTLRKNAFLTEPRLGEALGKIIGYSIALDGSDGRIKCEVRIGCTIGRGGSAVASGGEPTYCEVAYTGADYQQFTGRVVLFDTSVGYQPPSAAPNDDGLNLLSTLMAQDVIEIGLVVENPPAVQREHISAARPTSGGSDLNLFFIDNMVVQGGQELVQARSEAASNALKECETRATFKLKSMTGEFATDYEIAVTDLQIPTGYDLEAV